MDVRAERHQTLLQPAHQRHRVPRPKGHSVTQQFLPLQCRQHISKRTPNDRERISLGRRRINRVHNLPIAADFGVAGIVW
jgi:hypothetical protein